MSSEMKYSIKWIEDDEGHYIVIPSNNYKCGYQIIRGPFNSKLLAEQGLDQFMKTGQWPGKSSTEKDI